MINPLELAQLLIARASITPDDAGCQDILIELLSQSGFSIQRLPIGEVTNLWAKRGDQSPVLVFAGHTDVVPPGPLDQWASHPFEPTILNGNLYGRGAADMKGGIAAMISACLSFIKEHPDHKGSIAFLITSDEEGASIDGTVKVVEWLKARKETIDWCIVGEASSVKQLGDTIKIGRRGTLSGTLKIIGIQGHIAYPQLADNPIHRVTPALSELISIQWDQGNDFFQPTSFQISNIHAGTGAGNVIPGQLELRFNFRYSPEVTAEHLQNRVKEILQSYQLNYALDWQHSGKPFLTKPGTLTAAAKKAIQKVSGIEPELSTSGGTSDGRFIAEMGCEVAEIGPINASIHKINECVNIKELENLTLIYKNLLAILLG